MQDINEPHPAKNLRRMRAKLIFNPGAGAANAVSYTHLTLPTSDLV